MPRLDLRAANVWLLLAVMLCALAVQALRLDEALRFDRELVNQGHLWLLLTGNFAHLGWSHLWLNLAGLGLIGLVFSDSYRWWQWLTVGLLSSLAVTTGLWYFDPEWRWYVGLSGALHGLFVAGAIQLLRAERNFALVLLVGIAIKLVYEQVVGPSPGTAELAGGPVVVDAHLFGALGGALAAVMLLLYRQVSTKR
ncbi:MAG: rhombosortase [Thiotrichales bacterium]